MDSGFEFSARCRRDNFIVIAKLYGVRIQTAQVVDAHRQSSTVSNDGFAQRREIMRSANFDATRYSHGLQCLFDRLLREETQGG
jgi:hypothetical protein